MPAAPFGLPALLGGVALGILLADGGVRIHSDGLPLVAAAGVAALVIGVAAGRHRWSGLVVVAGLVVAGSLAGGWRHELEARASVVGASVASLADAGEQAFAGTVVEDPRARGERLQLVVGDLEVESADATVRLGDRLLLWLPRGIAVEAGDRVRFAARVRLAEDFDGFAYREYLARQRIGAIGEAQTAEVTGADAGPGAILVGLRTTLLDGLNRLVPEPEAALGAGILLGVRASMAPEINEAFERAGLTHVVAISGWNIAIVAALVGAAVRPLERRTGRVVTALAVAATVAGYVVLTGATPSVVRAALMAGALVVARLGGSPAHAGSALGLAALVMLLAAPSVLWDVGFQLSLLATGGLVWFGGSVERRLAAWPGLIREPVALTLAAQLTTLPVILVNFERLSLVAPIANVLVVPFVPLAMLCSAVASAVGVTIDAMPVPVLSDAAAWFAGGAAWLVLATMITIATSVAAVPHASVDVAVPAPFAVAWLPIVALSAWALGGGTGRPTSGRARPDTPTPAPAALARRVARPLPMAIGVVVVLAAVTVANRPDGRLHLTVLDVGQGDAILIEAPNGATMLVDGGADPDLTLRRLGANLPFHARTADVVLVSHPHQDHVAGLVAVLGRFEVGALLHAGIAFENQAYDQLLTDAASEPGIEVTLARAGQVIRLDSATSVEVVYPTDADARAPLPDGDINNGSVVIVVRHGGFAALLTGDAEAPIEGTLVRRGLVPDVDVLKVGHHGSSSSTTPMLLEAARPEVAVISAGRDNEYGHPAPETLDALARVAGIAVLRTDRDGDVQIATDGRTYRVRTAAGWGPGRVAGAGGVAPGDARSIGPCQSRTVPPLAASSPMPSCRTGSSSTPRVWPAWPSRPPRSWPRRRSPSTARWWRPPRCCTTSTSSRSAGRAGSTASSARGASRRRGTVSSPCRSPPIP